MTGICLFQRDRPRLVSIALVLFFARVPPLGLLGIIICVLFYVPPLGWLGVISIFYFFVLCAAPRPIPIVLGNF